MIAHKIFIFCALLSCMRASPIPAPTPQEMYFGPPGNSFLGAPLLSIDPIAPIPPFINPQNSFLPCDPSLFWYCLPPIPIPIPPPTPIFDIPPQMYEPSLMMSMSGFAPSMGPGSGSIGTSGGPMGGSPVGMGGSPMGMGGNPTGMGGNPTGMGGNPTGMSGNPMGMGGNPMGMGGNPMGMGGNPMGMGGNPMGMGGNPMGMGMGCNPSNVCPCSPCNSINPGFNQMGFNYKSNGCIGPGCNTCGMNPLATLRMPMSSFNFGTSCGSSGLGCNPFSLGQNPFNSGFGNNMRNCASCYPQC